MLGGFPLCFQWSFVACCVSNDEDCFGSYVSGIMRFCVVHSMPGPCSSLTSYWLAIAIWMNVRVFRGQCEVRLFLSGRHPSAKGIYYDSFAPFALFLTPLEERPWSGWARSYAVYKMLIVGLCDGKGARSQYFQECTVPSTKPIP